ncbi:MAG: hypothetical protein QJR14_09560 [Bacillota bacterium]|nr:hypothetical protein [Bacillota bacterium]
MDSADLVLRWAAARQRLTLAEDSGDWAAAELEAEAGRRELAELEARMTAGELREARRLFDAWFKRYLEED